MEPWLQRALIDTNVGAGELIVRLTLSLLLGWLVAVIYKRTSNATDDSSSFVATLVLLSILIAIVTQVIGDSVARAFSLVGALSIVRFRTVVRDTRDTAFVIFAVVMGMAAGASNLAVATSGALVVGVAAWLFRPTLNLVSDRITKLDIRLAIGQSPQIAILPLLGGATRHVELMAIETSKQGSAIDYQYRVRLNPTCDVAELVRALNQLDGVQSVRWAQLEEAP